MVTLGRDSHNIDGNSRPIRIRGLKNNLLNLRNLLDKNIRVNSWSVQFLVFSGRVDGGRWTLYIIPQLCMPAVPRRAVRMCAHSFVGAIPVCLFVICS